MENHPIPQDVTGFQFKLVGNMTLKQFGYVGCGVILSVVFYYIPVAFLIKFFCIPFFSVLGICLAFLPVEGRPIDLMARYFVTALLKPNQYVYQKTGGSFSFMELNLQPISPKIIDTPAIQKVDPRVQKKEEQLRSYLYDDGDSYNPLDQKENQQIAALFNQVMPMQSVPSFTPPPPVVTELPKQNSGITEGPDAPLTPPQPEQHRESPQPITPMPAMNVQSESVQPVIIPTAQPTAPAPSPIQTEAIQSSTTEVKDNPQVKPAGNYTFHASTNVTFNQQPQYVPAPLAPQEPEPVQEKKEPTPPGFTMQPTPPPTFVQVVPKTQTIQQTIKPVTGLEFPNLIKGIVKDARGNVLPGILVEVRNKEGDSVRAFKTNALGQFASATQLANGNYVVVFEDPKGQHKFDTVPVEANGSMLAPITVISIDAREELRRSLFG